MLFGQNFLPKTPARWTLTNATMTESEINLQSDGVANILLTAEELAIIPAALKLTIISDKYTDVYNPQSFVEFFIIDDDDNQMYSMCPIVDTGNGICAVEIKLRDTEYSRFKLTIRSSQGMKLSLWELAGPLEGDTSKVIDEIRGELPKLLYDYNTARFNVEQKEVTIALISANLIRNADMNGHLQLTYIASSDAVLVIRFRDNEVTELYAPLLYVIKAGRGNIGIPHAYLQKPAGVHTFTVTAQVTTGSLYFDVRGVLYTIDGAHLAERIMDVGMDVRDVALRRGASEDTPTWIYAIGIDSGKIMVKNRPYSDIAATAWEPVLIIDLTPEPEDEDDEPEAIFAMEAGIEFDGNWRIDGEVFRYETENIPWYFWINDSNELYRQYGNDETTRAILATRAIKLSVVRGYTNTAFVENDQGLVVFYIKEDGLVYYRAYCIFDTTTKIWEQERNVMEFSSVAVSLTTFRTNDYRVGLNIESISGITTSLLSPRNWAGIAIHPENLSISLEMTAKLLPVQHHNVNVIETLLIDMLLNAKLLFCRTDNTIISAENLPITLLNDELEEYQDWGFKIRFVLNYPTETLPIVVISDNTTSSIFTILTPIQINKAEFNVFIDSTIHEIGINNVEDLLKINITGIGNEAGYSYDTIDYTFLPTNLVPVAIPVPEVEEVWNE